MSARLFKIMDSSRKREYAPGFVLASCMTAVLLVLPAVALSQSTPSLEQRVAKMERMLESGTLLKLLQNVEELKAEVRDLRGQLEQQQFALSQMTDRQRELYLDVDRRMQRLEAGGVAVGAGAAGSAAPTSAPPAGSGTPGVSTSAAAAGGAAVAGAGTQAGAPPALRQASTPSRSSRPIRQHSICSRRAATTRQQNPFRPSSASIPTASSRITPNIGSVSPTT